MDQFWAKTKPKPINSVFGFWNPLGLVFGYVWFSVFGFVGRFFGFNQMVDEFRVLIYFSANLNKTKQIQSN